MIHHWHHLSLSYEGSPRDVLTSGSDELLIRSYHHRLCLAAVFPVFGFFKMLNYLTFAEDYAFAFIKGR